MLHSEKKGRYYQQVQSLRDLTGDNFPNGQIRFSWAVPANASWNPALSFFVMRQELVSFNQTRREEVKANVFEEEDYVVAGKRLRLGHGLAPVQFFYQ